MDQYAQLAKDLVKEVLSHSEHLYADPDHGEKVLAKKADNSVASLDLTPFAAIKQPATAGQYFAGVNSFKDLVNAYKKARAALPFEESAVSDKHAASDYEKHFVDQLFLEAEKYITEADVALVVNWVQHFDVYVAVKAVESLLNSKADLAMFRVAKKHGWDIHFDHLAIRCGTEKQRDLEKTAELLAKQHGYVSSQVESERYYQFPDGWNAMPMYKILENGLILRVFLDQSGKASEKQIIQHWNYVYGFTAHHLAMHATELKDGQRVSIPLRILEKALSEEGVKIMEPVGDYTEGLLEQVFTRPEKTNDIPQAIRDELSEKDKSLGQVIQNGKLLELLTRTEMSNKLAKRCFSLYGLEFDVNNPLHSMPIFPYFLPAQAAHVIKTSQETD